MQEACSCALPPCVATNFEACVLLCPLPCHSRQPCRTWILHARVHQLCFPDRRSGRSSVLSISRGTASNAESHAPTTIIQSPSVSLLISPLLVVSFPHWNPQDAVVLQCPASSVTRLILSLPKILVDVFDAFPRTLQRFAYISLGKAAPALPNGWCEPSLPCGIAPPYLHVNTR